MTELLVKAIKAIGALSETEQDSIAREILERIAEEDEWDALVASPASQYWLAEQAKKVREDIRQERVTPLDFEKKRS